MSFRKSKKQNVYLFNVCCQLLGVFIRQKGCTVIYLQIALVLLLIASLFYSAGEWFFKKYLSRKILAKFRGSRHLEFFFDVLSES